MLQNFLYFELFDIVLDIVPYKNVGFILLLKANEIAHIFCTNDKTIY